MVKRRRRERLPDGREVDMIEMPFQTGAEHWNEYVVNDGSVVRLKTVVTDILKVEDQYDPSGSPVYFVKSSQVISVSPSNGARKPPPAAKDPE
jgi:hypothetical protein